VCHGFKHSKEYLAGFLELFPQDSIFFIDFRGHGQSQGDRVSLGLNEYLDVVAAADYIKKNISSTAPLFGIGISLGGSAVLRAAAAGAPFDAVISDSAPSSFKDTVACILQKSRHIPYPIGWLALTWYELIMGQFLSNSCYTHYAAKITCPVLIMHDEYDHLIDKYLFGINKQNRNCKKNRKCNMLTADQMNLIARKEFPTDPDFL